MDLNTWLAIPKLERERIWSELIARLAVRGGRR